jgi:hypothetical protein
MADIRTQEFIDFTLATFNAIGDMISPLEAGKAWQEAFKELTDDRRISDEDLARIAEEQIDWIEDKLGISRGAGRLALLSTLMALRDQAQP